MFIADLPFFLLSFPGCQLGCAYGSIQPPAFSGTLSGRVLPLWGIAAQHERAQNSPEQNAMLLRFRHRKKIKDDKRKRKRLFSAQGDFQNIAGDELQRHLVSLPEVEKDCEAAASAT